MNIIFFIDEINSNSGFNYEIKYAKKNIESLTNHKIFLIDYSDLYQNSTQDRLSLGDLSFFNKYFKLKKFINKNNIQLAHVRGVGLGSLNHFYSYFFCYLMKTKLVVSTCSQINDYSLRNKIFYENPDVKLMDSNTVSFKQYLINLILKNVTPHLKLLYFHTIAKFYIKKASTLILFSNYEKNQVIKNLKNYDHDYHVISEPVLDIYKLKLIKAKFSGSKFYFNFWGGNDFINIIYWGRLDFETKGLDRIVSSFSEFIKLHKKTKLKIHFMGPDYNGGEGELHKLVNDLNLNNYLKIHPSKIWKGNPEPFINSDFSILATKVDGFPRSLRESIAFGVPIICSTESNFDEIISSFDCGFSFSSNNELINIFKNIENNNYSYDSLRSNCNKATIEGLSDLVITKKFTDLYEKQIENGKL
jgi:glycosyltransferase involved in cell wall biosynthesis